jgi:polyhydroxyalkanoate synthesis regulator phasin
MKKLILIGAGAVLLLGVMVVGAMSAFPMFASAQSNTITATPTSTPTPNPYCEQYLNDLANRLHVSVSTLQQDKLAAMRDVLARMVKDGTLTQKQANAIQQRLQTHQACTGMGMNRMEVKLVMRALQGYTSQITDQVASQLHLTPSQLQAQLRSGKSLSDVAAAQHVSSAQLHAIVMNAVQNALNKAVSNGDVTKQQANTFMQALQSHPEFVDHILHARYHGKARPQTSYQI